MEGAATCVSGEVNVKPTLSMDEVKVKGDTEPQTETR
jgi:hypothetical protein